jgi:hypothetical protein
MALEIFAEVGSEVIEFICGAELRRFRRFDHKQLNSFAEGCGAQSPPYPLHVRARDALAACGRGEAGDRP